MPRATGPRPISCSTAPIPTIFPKRSTKRQGRGASAASAPTPRARATPNSTRRPSRSRQSAELAGHYREIADRMPWLNVFGGCCGCDRGRSPKSPASCAASATAGEPACAGSSIPWWQGIFRVGRATPPNQHCLTKTYVQLTETGTGNSKRPSRDIAARTRNDIFNEQGNVWSCRRCSRIHRSTSPPKEENGMGLSATFRRPREHVLRCNRRGHGVEYRSTGECT